MTEVVCGVFNCEHNDEFRCKLEKIVLTPKRGKIVCERETPRQVEKQG